jgi:hypothetical protein
MTYPPAFAMGGSYQTALAQIGGLYITAANVFSTASTEVAGLDNPQGLRSTFVTAYSNLATSTNALGVALQAGIPTSPTPFSTLASDLSTFTTDLGLLSGSAQYASAAPFLLSSIAAMDDAAAQVTLGITGSDEASLNRQVLVINDFQAYSTGLDKFDQTMSAAFFASVPEPTSVLSLGTGLALVLLLRRLHRRGSRRSRPRSQA